MQINSVEDIIAVQVTPEYIAEQSTPEEQRYVFSYHIDIENQGDKTVQLMTRHWLITDGNGQVQEVQGEGVVGETPVIAPGENYHYSSGAVLSTQVGSMRGHYGMKIIADNSEEEKQNQEAESFKADIPVFTLAVPTALN